ncbi:putative respiratory chain protein [Thermoproteus uzoniensis 768-20]|uniref:Respiratory chain protein n=1 Tax=Thermoproteus uzoniensis (strain 768-20) TaxID=999630 RepID=F2L076_THEU7|nr:hypothetical protein [Thermoproteus uzoniensis]AEA12558.1 putative respiratory chain protein [Thermoproteus uzoniensis 768-20]
MRRLPLLAYILIVATSFTGSLTAGLGEGLDLGSSWPGAPAALLAQLAGGSVEPLHRILTVLAGVAVLAAFLANLRRNAPASAGMLASLIATALTGRLILLALAGQLSPPFDLLVYPANNLLALSSASFALALAVDSEIPWRRPVLLRGAAFWAATASALGAFLLGFQKVERVDVLSGPPVLRAALGLHIAAALLAIALAMSAYKHRAGNGALQKAVLWAAAAQALIGPVVLIGDLSSYWSPGFPVALHTAAAHLLASTCIVAYVRSRRA